MSMKGGASRTMLSVDIQRLLPKFLVQAKYDDLLTPIDEALEEMRRRETDPRIKERVTAYLGGDVPNYFNDGPILYMARHVATPNFETLRFLHLVEPIGLKTYIGQDARDTFVHQNHLKKALGKLPIYLGSSFKHGELFERYQYETIVDFNKADGKHFDTIKTLWGEDLVEFHNDLLASLTKAPMRIANDSAWIERQHRGDLAQHYKRFLALFVAHGILFEDYLGDDKGEMNFIRKVLRPAFKHVSKELGLRPLIVRLTPTSIESQRFWMSYPKEVLAVVQEKQKHMHTTP